MPNAYESIAKRRRIALHYGLPGLLVGVGLVIAFQGLFWGGVLVLGGVACFFGRLLNKRRERAGQMRGKIESGQRMQAFSSYLQPNSQSDMVAVQGQEVAEPVLPQEGLLLQSLDDVSGDVRASRFVGQQDMNNGMQEVMSVANLPRPTHENISPRLH